MRTARSSTVWGGCLSWQRPVFLTETHPLDRKPPPDTDLHPVNKMTDMYKNITLPQLCLQAVNIG